MQVFIIDMIISFNTPYYDESRVWVTDPYSVRMNYLKGWFVVDFISVLPFDIVSSFSSNRCAWQVYLPFWVPICTWPAACPRTYTSFYFCGIILTFPGNPAAALWRVIASRTITNVFPVHCDKSSSKIFPY